MQIASPLTMRKHTLQALKESNWMQRTYQTQELDNKTPNTTQVPVQAHKQARQPHWVFLKGVAITGVMQAIL